MRDYRITVSYADIFVMLGLALIVLWLHLRSGSLRPLLAQTMLSASGYLRPRPDQRLESALRSAFTQLDKELAAVLGDRPVPFPHS